MSLLLSDSLIGLVDEKSLEDETFDTFGKVQINNETYAVDAFVTDHKVIRIHAIADPKVAISLLNLRQGIEAKVTLGDDSFVASGKVQQIGFENLPQGGRIVISIAIRDK